MKDLGPFENGNTDARVDSASTERSVEFNTDEGVVKEKTSITYKAGRGNPIDNVANTISESVFVRKASKFINKLICFGLSGFGGFVAGAIAYDSGRSNFCDRSASLWGCVWEVPEPLVILGSIAIGLVSSAIVYTVYRKFFIK